MRISIGISISILSFQPYLSLSLSLSHSPISIQPKYTQQKNVLSHNTLNRILLLFTVSTHQWRAHCERQRSNLIIYIILVLVIRNQVFSSFWFQSNLVFQNLWHKKNTVSLARGKIHAQFDCVDVYFVVLLLLLLLHSLIALETKLRRAFFKTWLLWTMPLLFISQQKDKKNTTNEDR